MSASFARAARPSARLLHAATTRPACPRGLATPLRAGRRSLRSRLTTTTVAAAGRKGASPGMPPAAAAPPGRPLLLPNPAAIAAALGGLTWVTLLGFPTSPLPAPLRELGLAVVSEGTARGIAGAAWSAHAAEALFAAWSVLSAGGDAAAAAWWAFWGFFCGFPALLLMQTTLPKKQD